MVRRPPLAAACIVAALVAPAAAHAPASSSATVRLSTLDANHLAMAITNVGAFGWNPADASPGLEYPRGTGTPLIFAAGLWMAGLAAGTDSIRAAVAEFASEFVPGPSGAAPDFGVFRVSSGDTTGWAAWIAGAAPHGAPLDAMGRPALVGDQTTWTVFNDADPTTALRRGRRLTPPIGVEVQLTAYAFDRPGALGDAVFFHWRLIHQGTRALDGVHVGLFLDPLLVHTLLAACDTALDLGYAYRRTADDPFYGSTGPAAGIQLLRGPEDTSGRPLRMTSFVVYPNGTDPGDSLQFYAALRGLEPWGQAMVDSSTGSVTRFYSSGDPVTGSGWVASVPPHPHTVLASGPFRFAPGDTQEVDAAFVVGRGSDRLASIEVLRRNAAEIRAHFEQRFAGVPAPVPEPLHAWPNPAPGEVRIRFATTQAGPTTLSVFDVSGRRVRRTQASLLPGNHEWQWDRRDDHGRRVEPGLYLVRLSAAGRDRVARLVLIR